MTCVADSSSSMDTSTHVSSLDWSQPISRAEKSLELKWDDDDDDDSDDSDDSDDDQSQRPLEMKVNRTSSVEQTNDGKLCSYWYWLGYSEKCVYIHFL
jgi:hypothetical protein